MNNQNRPKANYHLLATVATLGPVRGGICSDKSLRTRSEATQGVWGIRSPVPPPQRLSEKSRRELKSLYPTTGATTNSQSSLGVLLLLRQSPQGAVTK